MNRSLEFTSTKEIFCEQWPGVKFFVVVCREMFIEFNDLFDSNIVAVQSFPYTNKIVFK